MHKTETSSARKLTGKGQMHVAPYSYLMIQNDLIFMDRRICSCYRMQSFLLTFKSKTLRSHFARIPRTRKENAHGLVFVTIKLAVALSSGVLTVKM